MPAKRRRRPVIEEIVETPAPKVKESHVPITPLVSENPVYVQTAKQVASYDEPPMDTPPVHAEKIQEAPIHPEVAAATFLERENGQIPQKKTNIKLILVITVLTALIVGFIAGGVYVYVSGVSDKNVPSATSTPEPTEVPVATATPKPVIQLDSFSVNVLNGSGVIGAAGKVKAALESAGFKISGTGNASNYSYKSTVISVKKDVPEEVVAAIKNALSGYTVEMGDELLPSSKYDIVVTSGKN